MFLTGKTVGQWFLLAIFVTVLYFCLRIMQPFLMAIFLALILSTLLAPFIDRFRIVTRATVLGNLVTALTQGAASALIFFSLALPNPVLWGALTALFSLIPVVGTALIWLPWAIYLFAAGSRASSRPRGTLGIIVESATSWAIAMLIPPKI
jgi:predicted PurR-regulated permease PerM